MFLICEFIDNYLDNGSGMSLHCMQIRTATENLMVQYIRTSRGRRHRKPNSYHFGCWMDLDVNPSACGATFLLFFFFIHSMLSCVCIFNLDEIGLLAFSVFWSGSFLKLVEGCVVIFAKSYVIGSIGLMNEQFDHLNKRVLKILMGAQFSGLDLIWFIRVPNNKTVRFHFPLQF